MKKKIIYAGKGPPPECQNGAKAFFDYRGIVLEENGEEKVIDDTRKSYPEGYGRPLELVFGKKFQLPIWEECIKSMIIDEVSSFDIPAGKLLSYPMVSKRLRDIGKKLDGKRSDHDHSTHGCFGMAAQMGTGYEELDKLLTQPRDMRFIFHLHKVVQPEDYEPDSWQLDEDQKLRSIPELKDKGNECVRKGQWAEAVSFYKEALGRFDTLQLKEKPGEPEHVELDEAKLPMFLNLALCYLKLDSFYFAIESANEALKRDPTNEKALYRRAKAHIGIWDLEAAKDDLEAMKTAHPKSTALAIKELELIKELIKHKVIEEKQRYKAMVSS